MFNILKQTKNASKVNNSKLQKQYTRLYVLQYEGQSKSFEPGYFSLYFLEEKMLLALS